MQFALILNANAGEVFDCWQSMRASEAQPRICFIQSHQNLSLIQKVAVDWRVVGAKIDSLVIH